MSAELLMPGRKERMPATNCRVLLVEDDPTMRIFLDAMLQKQGYTVTGSADVPDAQQTILRLGAAAFECVVTDYLMPGPNGLELLRWLGEQDHSLATIVVTAESEREIVAESLREGACDFLEKPVVPKKLYAAVERAIGATRHKRRQALTEAAVREVGKVQHQMLGSEIEEGKNQPEIEVFFRPKSDAGGDFLNHFGIGANNYFVLLTDVSGHDLKAAFISAYFQGIVRGMLESNATVERVFEFFNGFLLREWSSVQSPSRPDAVSASVAVGAIFIEPAHQRATVLTSGSPRPVYVGPDGRARLVGEAGSAPLGWFEENPVKAAHLETQSGGAFFLWTDGLESFAEAQNLSAAGVATVLLLAQNGLRTLPDLEPAQDDILTARVGLPGAEENADAFLPLLVEEYNGGQAGAIDELQIFWTRTLLHCLPEISQEVTFNVILSAREAMLNALAHGCAGSPDRTRSRLPSPSGRSSWSPRTSAPRC